MEHNLARQLRQTPCPLGAISRNSWYGVRNHAPGNQIKVDNVTKGQNSQVNTRNPVAQQVVSVPWFSQISSQNTGSRKITRFLNGTKARC